MSSENMASASIMTLGWAEWMSASRRDIRSSIKWNKYKWNRYREKICRPLKNPLKVKTLKSGADYWHNLRREAVTT